MDIVDIFEQAASDVEFLLLPTIKRNTDDQTFFYRIVDSLRRTKQKIRQKSLLFDNRSGYSLFIEDYYILRQNHNDNNFVYNYRITFEFVSNDTLLSVPLNIANDNTSRKVIVVLNPPAIDNRNFYNEKVEFAVRALTNNLVDVFSDFPLNHYLGVQYLDDHYQELDLISMKEFNDQTNITTW